MPDVGATPDEPSVFVAFKRCSLVLWLGDLRDWKLGREDHRRNQNPHWQFYFGPLSLVVWA